MIWPGLTETQDPWLCRAPPAPPQVLKTLQGVRWLSADSDAYVVDLFVIVGEFEATEDNDAQTLLQLSAGLLPSLIAPETNLLA